MQIASLLEHYTFKISTLNICTGNFCPSWASVVWFLQYLTSTVQRKQMGVVFHIIVRILIDYMLKWYFKLKEEKDNLGLNNALFLWQTKRITLLYLFIIYLDILICTLCKRHDIRKPKRINFFFLFPKSVTLDDHEKS